MPIIASPPFNCTWGKGHKTNDKGVVDNMDLQQEQGLGEKSKNLYSINRIRIVTKMQEITGKFKRPQDPKQEMQGLSINSICWSNTRHFFHFTRQKKRQNGLHSKLAWI